MVFIDFRRSSCAVLPHTTGRPGGVAGCPRACCYRSISWVRAPPTAYAYKFVGTVSCAQIDSRKTRKREIAFFDESRRAVGMLNPMRDENWRHVPGGRRDDTWDHSLLSRSWKVKANNNNMVGPVYDTLQSSLNPTLNWDVIVWYEYMTDYITRTMPGVMWMLQNFINRTSRRGNNVWLWLWIVVVVSTSNRSFYPTTTIAVPPVSLLIHPREIQILWSQTVRQRRTKR